jgi:hypothetical protein
MDRLDRRQLAALARLEGNPCLSLFMPVTGGGAASKQEPVRLANLIRDAVGALAERDYDDATAASVIEPIERLAAGEGFWSMPAGGVAIFSALNFLKVVRTDFALPERFAVGDRFAIRPLLPMLDRPERYYALAVSLNDVRLVEGGADGPRRLELPGLPTSFDAAMGYVEYESGVTQHTGSPSALGRRSAIFHGHGDGDEENQKDDVLHYLRRIVDVLERELPDPWAPLVFAGVSAYPPLFARANRRLAVAVNGIVGNPELLSDKALDEAARQFVSEEQQRRLDAELSRWFELRGHRRGIEAIDEIVLAADQGAVETLFVAREAERWGSFEPDLCRVELHEAPEPGDVELLELAVERTLTNGGDVHAIPLAAMPEGRMVVATRRFAAA